MREVLAAALLLTGSTFALIAAIGLHRFPDVFCRMHAATKPATLGIGLVALGGAVFLRDPDSVIKLILVLILQFLTNPVGAHMIGRSAYRAGGQLSDITVVDELAQR